MMRTGKHKSAYTFIELMITILIVTILSATIGAFLANMLSIEEKEREEAYVREKLADVCARYADLMSIGTRFSVNTNPLVQAMMVDYRKEAGGVSLETGLVTRVSKLTSMVNTAKEKMDLDIYSFTPEGLEQTYTREMTADAHLIPFFAGITTCTIRPLNYSTNSIAFGYNTTDAALGYLEVTANYEMEDKKGNKVPKTIKAGRVVRLWNWSKE